MADSTATIHLHPDDPVVIAARPLEAGESLAPFDVAVREFVKMGHKVACRPIARSEPIRKYGQIIGQAARDIAAGEWVHVHNVELTEFARDSAPCSEIPVPLEPVSDRTFQGYRRADGRAGTRNYLAVISTVNCSATAAKYIAQRFEPSLLRDYAQIDGVVAFTHDGGCAMDFAGESHEALNRVLAGIARHPNIGGYLLVGLGCEQAAMGYLLDSQKLIQIGEQGRQPGPPVFSIQDMGGTSKTVDAAVQSLTRLLPEANDIRRQSIPASELVLATECGGSDGNSGITANPVVGIASDLLVACGATTVLAETTEIFGAEHLLTRRARSPEVAQRLLDRIAWWQRYASFFGVELDSNPSVGNKEGGLTTIVEKSLGAIAKAGSTALNEVYRYAEPIRERGLVVMDTPGFDPPSVTGMVAGGANMVVFTTGRGSCFGCKPAPTIKVATNTPMYERMIDDMDLNAGTVLEGRSVQQVGRELFELILQVASGEPTKSESLGLGDEEFVPWNSGPVL